MADAACKLLLCSNKLAASVAGVQEARKDNAFDDRAMLKLAGLVDEMADKLNEAAIELSG